MVSSNTQDKVQVSSARCKWSGSVAEDWTDRCLAADCAPSCMSIPLQGEMAMWYAGLIVSLDGLMWLASPAAVL